MALQTITFDGQPNGATVTTATSDDNGDPVQTWQQSVSGTANYTTADAAHGDACVELSGAAGLASIALCDVDDAAPSALFSIAMYFKWVSYPTATNDQMGINIRGLANNLGRIDASTTGQFRVNMGIATAYTTALALNTWYRLEFYGSGLGTAASAATLDIYAGDSTTLFATAGVTGQTTAAQAQRGRYGCFSGAALAGKTYRIDSIRQNIGSATPLGPWPAAPTATMRASDLITSPTAAIRAATR